MHDHERETLRAETRTLSPTNWPDPAEVKSFCEIIRPSFEHGWKINALILSDWVYETRTHYVGRTLPCNRPHGPCPYCKEGRADRWAGYLAVLRENKAGFAILEITPGATPVLKNWCETEGSLRGCVIEIERKKNKANAAVVVRRLYRRPEEPGFTLAPAFDLVEALYRIWQVRKKPLHTSIADADPIELEAALALKRATVIDQTDAQATRFGFAPRDDQKRKRNGTTN